MNNETILAIMPVYNSEKTLKMAIDSILKQTYKNIHLVIVDDCSTDGSLEIAQSYNTDKRVTLIRNRENKGAYYSRNVGLYKFRNQDWGFFTTHDADDVSRPDRFQLMHKLFRNDRTNAVQDTWERKRLSDGRPIKTALTCAHAMFKRQVFLEVGYFDMMRFGADWEYWARVNMSNKPSNRITRSVTECLGESFMGKGNLTEQIPEGSAPRTQYVEESRKEHLAMQGRERGFYRDFNTKMVAKDMSAVSAKTPNESVKKVEIPTMPKKTKTKNYNNVRITVVLLTWQRIGLLKKTLESLSNQTFQNFEVHISNANLSQKKNVESYSNLFSDRLKIRVTHDGNDIYAFRRFTVGKKLAEEGTDIILFIDDDITFQNDYLENTLRYYEPKSYKSGFAWSFQDKGSDYYGKRTRIRDNSSKIHYCGTGISIIDASIFLDDALIDTAPDEALKIEDLWLSYYAQHVKKWKLGYIEMNNASIGGDDSVALYKTILNEKKKGMPNKADFLNLLVKKYRWKL